MALVVTEADRAVFFCIW